MSRSKNKNMILEDSFDNRFGHLTRAADGEWGVDPIGLCEMRLRLISGIAPHVLDVTWKAAEGRGISSFQTV